MLFFNTVFAAALLFGATGPSYQPHTLLLFAAFSAGFFPVPISTPNLTIFPQELVPKETSNNAKQQQACEGTDVKALTSSAVMGQGPGFVNQKLRAALGPCNHIVPSAP